MEIRLTANRQSDEPWRIERLQQVAAECPKSVIALHDHKGTLSVNWSAPPSVRELTAMVQAWAAHNEIAIDHFVCGVEHDVETMGSNPFEFEVVDD